MKSTVERRDIASFRVRPCMLTAVGYRVSYLSSEKELRVATLLSFIGSRFEMRRDDLRKGYIPVERFLIRNISRQRV